MVNARWSIKACSAGDFAVEIAGKARLMHFSAHERCGVEGSKSREHECFALMTIPLRELEEAQVERCTSDFQEGGAMQCDSRQYECSFFLPTCSLDAIRLEPETDDGFAFRTITLEESHQIIRDAR